MTPRFAICSLLLVTGIGCRSARMTSNPPPPTRPIVNGHFEEFEAHPPLTPTATGKRRLQASWDRWADENLQTGDIVFRRESWRVAAGTWDVTKFISKIADSNFSHVGIVSVEEGRAYVYDTTRLVGPRRARFHEFLFASEMNFGIKRPRPEYREAIPTAMAYVDRVYEDRVPFDPDFEYGEETIYCTEMIEFAYRSAGVELSQRTAYADFPNWGQYPMQAKVAEYATGWVPTHEVYAPGNADFGLWGSDKLELVLVARNPYDPAVVGMLPVVPDDEVPQHAELPNDPLPDTAPPARGYTRFTN